MPLWCSENRNVREPTENCRITIGPNWNYPEDWNQDHVTTTYEVKWHKGTHDLKVGSELHIEKDAGWWRARSRGQMFFSTTPADLPQRVPLAQWTNPAQWNLAGLDSIATRFDIYYAPGDDWTYDVPRPMYAGWLGDTWAVNNRLTLNLGVRYDVAWKDFVSPGNKETTLIINNGFNVQDYGYKNNIRDLSNVAPRVGFAWNVTGKNDLVIRGGSGLFTQQLIDLAAVVSFYLPFLGLDLRFGQSVLYSAEPRHRVVRLRTVRIALQSFEEQLPRGRIVFGPIIPRPV